MKKLILDWQFKGESVIAEDPLLFVKNDENKIESLNLQFQNLSSDNQKKISSLCDSNSSGDPDKKIVRIFHSNCIQGGKQQHF